MPPFSAPQYQPHSTPSSVPSRAQQQAPEPIVELPPAPTVSPEPKREDSMGYDSELDEFAMAKASRRVHSGQSLPNPCTLKEALKRHDASEWQAAADAEIKAHVENGTWEPCKLPAGRSTC